MNRLLKKRQKRMIQLKKCKRNNKL